MGTPEAAMSIITKALALTPDSHDLHRLQGTNYQVLGQNEKALASYEEARRLKPDDADTLLALSSL
jgi:Tfp pilus assembly protein PilF